MQVGQKVVVSTIGISRDHNGMGTNIVWNNLWMNPMNALVGKTLTIAPLPEHCFFEDGVAFEETEYLLPLNILVAVEEEVVC